MISATVRRLPWLGFLLLSTILWTSRGATTGELTVAVQSESPAAIPLVRHEEPWRLLRGDRAPQANWLTASDVDLTAAWERAPGGFGYGDSGIVGQATILADMRQKYTTLASRREFELGEPIDPGLRLRLQVDFDDGFVAFLDGVELARVNVDGPVGQPADHRATASDLHEASCCNAPTHPPEVFDLGPVGARLAAGRHVLAIQGLNASASSSDFHLIADLTAAPVAEVTAGSLLVVSRVPVVSLSGTNTVVGVVSIKVAGEAAVFDSTSGRWTIEQALAPGFNRLLVEGRDAAGQPLVATHLDVVYADHETAVDGTVGTDTTWTSALGVVRVNGPVRVAAGSTLTLAAGTVVLFGGAGELIAEDAALRVEGTPGQPVYLLPADGSSAWAGIHVSGAGGALVLQFAEIVSGQVEVTDGATGVVEDSTMRDLPTSAAIIHASRAAAMEVRRCYLARYHETLFQYTPTLIEDCLLEQFADVNSDGIDFDGAPAGSVIRRCTIRHGRQTNSDAIDIGSGSMGVTIEECWLYDFSDKGVSIGEDSFGIVVTNCLIHDTGIGVEIKDGCTAGVFQSTIADCGMGMRLRIKSGSEGGHLTNSFNNILWGNAQTIVRLDDSTVVATHSDLEGGWPGAGNRDEAPRFVDAARGDYRLASDSPLRTAGFDGAPMGTLLPVGAEMAPSSPRLTLLGELAAVRLEFRADPERTYVLESTDVLGEAWRLRERVLPAPWPRTMVVNEALSPRNRFFRLLARPAE